LAIARHGVLLAGSTTGTAIGSDTGEGAILGRNCSFFVL